MFGLSYIKLGAIAALAFLLLGMVTAILWFRSAAHDAEHARQIAVAERDQAVSANETQKAAIHALQESRRIDDTVTAQLVQVVERLDKSSADVQTKITSLERGSDEIRNFLAASVPSDLADVFNGTAAKGGKRNVGASTPAVRSTGQVRKAKTRR